MALTIQINWDNYKNFKIIDVHEKLHEEVRKFMVAHFQSYEIFKVLNIQEEPGIEEDLQIILKHILENDCSIAVIDKETNNILAVALLKCMYSEWRSWTNLRLIIKSERFMELCEMVRSCLKQHAKKSHDISFKDSLHIFSYHVREEFEIDKCLKVRFFNAILEVARHMHMPRVTYMCLSRKNHDILQSEDFKEVVRIMYSLYLYKGRRPFDRLRDINEMYGSLYEKTVEPLKPFNELIIRHAQLKVSKDDKKKKNGKEKIIAAANIEHVND